MGLPHRLLPALDQDNEFFWTSGRDGRLRFLRCPSCGYYVHPPAPLCPRCLDRHPEPAAVSGRATVHSFTVNHQRWSPDATEPYVIAIVEMAEQDDLRLTTNLVDVDPDEVVVGMPVAVRFEDHDPVFLPVFAPAAQEAP